MTRALLKCRASCLWCVAWLLAAGTGWAQEAGAPSDPTGAAGGGVQAMAILIQVFLAVLLPILTYRIMSYFIMEDDRLRHALALYVSYLVLALVWGGGLFALLWFNTDNELTLFAILTWAVLGLALYFYLPMRIYFASFFRTVLFLVASTVLIGVVTTITQVAISDLEVGQHLELLETPVEMSPEVALLVPGDFYHAKLNHYRQENNIYASFGGFWSYLLYQTQLTTDILNGKHTEEGLAFHDGEPLGDMEAKKTTGKPKEPASKARQAPKIYSAYSTPPPSEPEATVAASEQGGGESAAVEVEAAAPASPEPAPEPKPEQKKADSFQAGQRVAMRTEITIPTEYGDLKIRSGDEVTLDRKAGPDEWIAKRGMMTFRVKSSDLRPVRR